MSKIFGQLVDEKKIFYRFLIWSLIIFLAPFIS